MQKITFSPEAQSQLAKLYNAVLQQKITLAEYQELVEWFEQAVIRQLEDHGFTSFGTPATHLYGLLTDPTTRILTAIHLPRTVRVTVTQDHHTQDVMIADIVFHPSF